MDDGRYCVVYVTCPDLALAQSIAEAVVSEKLAACVNIVPQVSSVFFWQGQVQKESEALLVIKTVRERLPGLEARVKALHSYTVPEFIALPVIAGSQAYLDWVDENTAASETGET